MLTDTEREEIDEELEGLPTRQAASIEALKVVQEHRGWVDDEALEAVADYLEMSVDALDNVATFFNLIYRGPVGEHVILVCDSVSCWLCGYEELREQLSDRLGIGFGETTSDDQFTLLPMCCLGKCDDAPVMIVDGDTYGEVTPDKVDSIIGNYEV